MCCEGERSPQFANQMMGSGEPVAVPWSYGNCFGSLENVGFQLLFALLPVKIRGNLKTVSDRCHESREASCLQLQQGQCQVLLNGKSGVQKPNPAFSEITGVCARGGKGVTVWWTWGELTNVFPKQNDFILHYRKCCALQAGRRESPAFNYDSTLSFTDNCLFVIKGGKN